MSVVNVSMMFDYFGNMVFLIMPFVSALKFQIVSTLCLNATQSTESLRFKKGNQKVSKISAYGGKSGWFWHGLTNLAIWIKGLGIPIIKNK